MRSLPGEPRTARLSAVRLLVLLLSATPVVLVAGCGGESDRRVKEDRSGAASATPVSAASTAPDALPAHLEPCFACHSEQVMAFREHGMAASLGTARPDALPEPGMVVNAASGARYEVRLDGGDAWLDGRTADGGLRTQRVVGRIGAGVYDRSWVGEEMDPVSGRGTGRLFFAPIESITDHGLELSPFELHGGGAGLDFPLADGCLTCHTDTDPAGLPGARTDSRGEVFPANAFGADAFRHLEPLSCDACHGDTSRHRRIVTGEVEPRSGEGVGITRWRDLSVGARRDVCARCHLQGDARLELTPEPPDPWHGGADAAPLAGRIPVLVPARPVEGFRFVGQVEQLAKSACFRRSPDMTCATCHDPHQGVAAQGTASFDAACRSCHQDLAAGHAGDRPVAEVAGRPGRTEAGCVDCHVPYGEPVDLPHVVTADHFVRRRLPESSRRIWKDVENASRRVTHSQFLAPDGPVEVYGDDRLKELLARPGGARWRDGVIAMGLMSMSRFDEAADLFARFPAPGGAAARRATAPEGLVPVETFASFHHLRALALQAAGDVEAASAAYDDALALAPGRIGPRLDRARLRLAIGDLTGVVADTEFILGVFPDSEPAWNLRGEMAVRLGRPDMARQAYEESARIWPSNPVVWYQLAELRRITGDPGGAAEALRRGQALAPSGPPRPPAPDSASR